MRRRLHTDSTDFLVFEPFSAGCGAQVPGTTGFAEDEGAVGVFDGRSGRDGCAGGGGGAERGDGGKMKLRLGVRMRMQMGLGWGLMKGLGLGLGLRRDRRVTIMAMAR